MVRGGASVALAGRRLLLRPWKDETFDFPAPLVGSGVQVDVIDDLVAYTRLPRERVLDLLHRRHDSFRAEWHLVPPPLRVDDWFYLSSSTYLFGNATHDPGPLLSPLDAHLVLGGRALDFGGGAGNLAIALALQGWEVDYLERSALQKDFVAFRRDRHALGALQVLNDWNPLPVDRYDLVCAFDVFEHVAELEALLRDELVPAVRNGGVLAELSPFVRNLSNPMHHEHRILDGTLSAFGFQLEAAYPEVRVWRKGSSTEPSRSNTPPPDELEARGRLEL
jgi:2-polyprenyl-3-methyl-5-hydroxy-6-metoxy-1,4-benzoquinol methylase